MLVFFANNDEWYTRLSMKASGESLTHVALGFFTGESIVVVECTKPVARVTSFEHFLESYNLLDAYALTHDSTEKEAECFNALVSKVVGRRYDWGAYWYAIAWILRRRLTGEPFPDENKWSKNGEYLCTEIFEPIRWYLGMFDICFPEDLAAMTPAQQRDIIAASDKARRVDVPHNQS